MRPPPSFDPHFDPFCQESIADVIRRWQFGKELDAVDREVLQNAMAQNAQEQAGVLR